MNVDIDPEKLILLVKHTPVLWDRTQEGYKSRVCTKNAWRAVCARMIPGFNNMSDVYKENYEKHFVKKWRNIKDNYIKSRKKFRRANQKKYIFHRHLAFLDGTVDARETRAACSSDNEEGELPDPPPGLEVTKASVDADSCTDIKTENPDTSEECILPDNLSSTAGFEKESHLYGETFSNELCSSVPTTSRMNPDTEMVNQSSVEENRHMLFFKSVLPSLKDFTDDDTLAFQAAVICAIRDIKKLGK